jgi:hypothetical protein
MKIHSSSVLLCAVVSMAVGCQPELASAPMEPLAAQAGTLEGEIGSWVRTAPLASSMALDNALLLNATGEVLVQKSILTQRYDPYSNTWRSAKPLCSPCVYAPGTGTMRLLPSGQVLSLIPFSDGRRGFSALYTFDPGTDTWTRLESGFSVDRRSPSMTVLDSGQVLFVGGFTYMGDGRVARGSSEAYDPATETWSVLPGNLNTPRWGHTATVLYSGEVLVTGGENTTGRLASAELYNPATGTWSRAGSMSQPRSGHLALRLYSGNVMVLRDEAAASTAVDMYDPYNARWFQGPALPFARPATATLLYSGEVLVTSETGQAAVYSPSQDAWLPTAAATVGSASRSAAVLLHTGEVMLLSGSESVAERFTR